MTALPSERRRSSFRTAWSISVRRVVRACTRGLSRAVVESAVADFQVLANVQACLGVTRPVFSRHFIGRCHHPDIVAGELESFALRALVAHLHRDQASVQLDHAAALAVTWGRRSRYCRVACRIGESTDW